MRFKLTDKVKKAIEKQLGKTCEEIQKEPLEIGGIIVSDKVLLFNDPD